MNISRSPGAIREVARISIESISEATANKNFVWVLAIVINARTSLQISVWIWNPAFRALDKRKKGVKKIVSEFDYKITFFTGPIQWVGFKHLGRLVLNFPSKMKYRWFVSVFTTLPW